MTGYSDTPLLKKLGYKAGENVFTLNAPGWFRVLLGQSGVVSGRALPTYWAHGFFTSQVEVENFLDTIDFDQIVKGIWVSWPKKASGKQTDLTEQTFRDLILPLGWVDIKVAAIDNTWSGLKFTRRITPS
ncbi:MAG TPA: hypothetical protein VLE69_02800 [Candidatus Saccharimonadales bacterium]|nr:hypothetical protein [Candidatus Saccharimonadales bacterium]